MLFAQTADIRIDEPPSAPPPISLETGDVAGATNDESWLRLGAYAVVRNVRHATLYPILPDKDKATGAAVVIAPGGGFIMLSMQSEGWDVAHWLADHGIAAFVLKYRLIQMPEDPKDFFAEAGRRMDPRTLGNPGVLAPLPDAVADAEAALKMVKLRAHDWGVDPARVGMIGFSAGAVSTLTVVLQATPNAGPAFLAQIYGPMTAVTVPVGAPPLFAVVAANDPFFSRHGFGLVDAWIAANRPVEFHLYEKGGHGFGLGQGSWTTADWPAAFYHWLEQNGVLQIPPLADNDGRCSRIGCQ